MPLPLFTTADDVNKVIRYLLTKPTGATTSEAKKVLGAAMLDHRKIAALKLWRLVVEDGGRLKLTEEARNAAKNNQASLPHHFRNVIRNIEAYNAVIERAFHAGEDSITSTDVASYWHENFSNEVQSTDRGINDQAVCFFHIAQGAELGTLTLGRRGSPTRVDLDRGAIEAFVQQHASAPSTEVENSEEVTDESIAAEYKGRHTDNGKEATPASPKQVEKEGKGVQRVFITHGKNKKIVEQLKEIVTYGKLTAVIAADHETLSKPIPDKVMDDMRSCDAAIIHVASENILFDGEGKQHHKINENVLIEIGAAMALYKHNNRYNFILLVESGVQLPSNLQGLYQCRYEGDKLDMEATMKLLKAFNEFSVT